MRHGSSSSRLAVPALLVLVIALAGCLGSEAHEGDNPTSTPARAALPAPADVATSV